jgi:hypothetical protein
VTLVSALLVLALSVAPVAAQTPARAVQSNVGGGVGRGGTAEAIPVREGVGILERHRALRPR